MDKKHKNILKIPPFVTLRHFSEIGLCHFCTLMLPELHAKKLEKTNGVSYILKDRLNNKQTTDHGPTNRGDYIGPLLINSGVKWPTNVLFLNIICKYVWCQRSIPLILPLCANIFTRAKLACFLYIRDYYSWLILLGLHVIYYPCFLYVTVVLLQFHRVAFSVFPLACPCCGFVWLSFLV